MKKLPWNKRLEEEGTWVLCNDHEVKFITKREVLLSDAYMILY